MRFDVTNGIVVRRRAMSPIDWWFLLIILALLVAILLPTLSRARELAKRAVCSSNLRGIGQALHIYANDHAEWFPHHFYRPSYRDDRPGEHGVSWVGTMGSNAFLKVSESTGKKSADRNHPSRSLFMLLTRGLATPKSFICPSSGDQEDNLRNHGPDSTEQGLDAPAHPGADRFDFRGYRHLSYGYQLPFGPKGKPRTALDSRMAISADKGPYYALGGDGLAGTGTTRDTRSDREPPQVWETRAAEAIHQIGSDEWRPYNSRSHRGEGQNVLFLDAHAQFARTPIVGVNRDNIYTLAGAPGSAIRTMIGAVPGISDRIGPQVETDSFIVP